MSSILDQIMINQKTEEIAHINAVEIIGNLFNALNERERNIIKKRFGLDGDEKATLEEIGATHGLTRERIRQIEASGIKNILSLSDLNTHVGGLRRIISQLLEEHGGVMEREYLLNNIIHFSVGSARNNDKEKQIHKNNIDFIISKILKDEFDEVTKHQEIKESIKLKFLDLTHVSELVKELSTKVEDLKQVLSLFELIDLTKSLESFKKYQDKLAAPNNLDIRHMFNAEHLGDRGEEINEHKAIYSILEAADNIEKNKFGFWGMKHWPEVNPKTINEKIYLVLKHNKEPMHFTDIAERINNVAFDTKKAHPATVHNELILDKKYVLVGRGIYSLKEWGYEHGTVADIVANILETKGELTQDEIIEQTLGQRLVKKSTIILALANRDRFDKQADEKYSNKK